MDESGLSNRSYIGDKTLENITGNTINSRNEGNKLIMEHLD